MNLDSKLAQLEHAALVRRLLDEERAYIFKHALTQEAAYESLLHKSRRDIHRHIAECYEKLYPDHLDDYAPILARHYEEAGENAKAVAYLRKAGERANKLGAVKESFALVQRALNLTPQDDSAMRGALLVLLGNINFTFGDLQIAAKHFNEGLALARQSGDFKIIVDALSSLFAIARDKGDYEEAGRLAEEALAMARQGGERLGEAWALVRLGELARNREDYSAAIEYSNEALTLLQDLGDESEISFALADLGYTAFLQRDYAAARQHAEEALAIARKLGNDGLGVNPLNLLGSIYYGQGDSSAAVSSFEQALHISRQLGFQYLASVVVDNLGWVAARQGDDKAAMGYFRQVLREGHDFEANRLLIYALAGIGLVWTRTGRYQKAAEIIGLALGHPATEPGVKQQVPSVLDILRAALSTDELEAAMARGKQMDLDEVVNDILGENDAAMA